MHQQLTPRATLVLLGRHAIAVTASSIAIQTFTFVTNLAVSRLLGRTGFGEFAFLQATLIAAAGLAQLGVPAATTKYTADLRYRDPSLLGDLLSFCTRITSAGSIVAAAVVALLSFHLDFLHQPSTDLAWLLCLGSLSIPLSNYAAFQSSVLNGLQALAPVAVVSWAITAAGLAILVPLLIRFGLAGAIVALLAYHGARCIAFSLLTRRLLATNRIESTGTRATEIKSITSRYLAPGAGGALALMAGPWIASTWLARQPDGFAELATYTAAVNLKSLLLFVPLSLASAGSILLNVTRRQGQNRRAVAIACVAATLALTAAGAASATIWGPWVLSWFGKDYSSTSPAIRWMLWASVPEGLLMCLVPLQQADERMWRAVLTVTLPWQAAFIVLTLTLTPGRLAEGTALAYLIATSIAAVSSLWYSRVLFDD